MRTALKSLAEWGGKHLFEYETPRVITIRNHCVGLIYRTVQVCVLVYVIGYVFIWTKSYQKFETAESSVTTKIKGVLLSVNSTRRNVWDAMDFVIPAQEKDAFFIATSVLHTTNQTQGTCAEDPDVNREGVYCQHDDDCVEGQSIPGGNGVKTGRCIDWNATVQTCEIMSWCPLEADYTPQRASLRGFETVTVLVRNHVAFPYFDVKRRNILDSVNQTYLEKCRYDPIYHPFCPVFGITDLVRLAGEDFAQIASKGGIIAFTIQWDCNLDFDVEYCLPEYSFRRLDDKEDKIAKGWNFRQATYHQDQDGNDRRDSDKFWGIRFVIIVNGQAGKFSVVDFALNVGSGLGLLSIASLICELFLLTCVRPNTDLVQHKFVRL